MLNPTTYISKFKFDLKQILKIPIFTAFSNEHFSPPPEKALIIEIKNMTTDQIKFSMKIVTNKKNGYETCVNLTNKLIQYFHTNKNFNIIAIHTLPLMFDTISNSIYQDTQVTLKEPEQKNDFTLTFASETIIVQNNTKLKIERQTIDLGPNLDKMQLLFEFQQPVKKIEGCAQTNSNQFNTLLNFLNLKKIAPLTFKNQTFNATLLKLTINSVDLINFKFVEAENYYEI